MPSPEKKKGTELKNQPVALAVVLVEQTRGCGWYLKSSG
jgi:hypothetical protein